MTNFAKRCCTDPSCEKYAAFGLPGLGVTVCSTHRAPRMVKNPNRRCDAPRCTHTATHGFMGKDPSVCEYHSTSEHVNITLLRCTSCNLESVVDANGLCEQCDPTVFERVRLAKQNAVGEFLSENLDFGERLVESTVDVTVNGCTKYRPDFTYDIMDRVVVIEVDEHQHQSYDAGCERRRMFNIAQSYGGTPVCFIRFNPDRYVNSKGMKGTAAQDERYAELLKMIALIADEWQPTTICNVVHMYYDGRDDFGKGTKLIRRIDAFVEE